jgi:hypothetical protein
MPAPKAMSHGFGGGAGGGGALSLRSAASAGVAKATAVATDKINFFILPPLTPNRDSGGCALEDIAASAFPSRMHQS